MGSLRKFFKEVSEVFHDYFKIVLIMFCGCFKSVLRVFQGCSKDYRISVKRFLRGFQGNIRVFQK